MSSSCQSYVILFASTYRLQLPVYGVPIWHRLITSRDHWFCYEQDSSTRASSTVMHPRKQLIIIEVLLVVRRDLAQGNRLQSCIHKRHCLPDDTPGLWAPSWRKHVKNISPHLNLNTARWHLATFGHSTYSDCNPHRKIIFIVKLNPFKHCFLQPQKQENMSLLLL